MRHLKRTAKLGRTGEHRNAMLANLVCSLIKHKRVTTTLAKAKAARSVAEKLVTLGKKDTIHARRLVAARLHQEDAMKILFAEIAPAQKDRNGGYTRIVRTGFRQGDGGESVFIELLGNEKFIAAKRKKSADARAKRVDEARKQLEADNKALEAEEADEKKSK